jgi:hypothetical protein
MVLDLRTMDKKIRLWLGAEDLDEDDRQALETVRHLISDLISRAYPQKMAVGSRSISWSKSSIRGQGAIRS